MSTQDRKFFDLFMIVLAVLVGISVLIFVLSDMMSDATQGDFISSSAEFQEEVDKRIAPVGKVLMPGESAEAVETVAAVTPVAAELTGAQVYNQSCGACHTNGIGGSPKLGDVGVWSARVAQGLDVLREHAIKGFQGDTGYMPAKGGNLGLSDDEVNRAVDYMVAEAAP